MMAEARVKKSMFDVVRQISITENLQLTHVQRSASDGANFRPKSKRWSNSCGIIYRVTQAIQRVHVHDDHILQLIRLECPFPDRSRFLAVVSNDKVKEYCLLGVDCINDKEDSDKRRASNVGFDTNGDSIEPRETIGLVMKLSASTAPQFTGDGGFKIKHNGRSWLFKPVSIQVLWKLNQTFNMISERMAPMIRPGSTPTSENLDVIPEGNVQELPKNNWIKDYEEMINSPQSCINYWERFEDILSKRPPSPARASKRESRKLYDGIDVETAIKTKLRRIMRHVDLDRITSRVIRKQLEGEMGENLDKYRTFIDEEILLVLGQLDQSSKILDYLYLGSEWNASNFDELKENKITHILNVTREIDNFYPGSFKYKNIRVWDLGIL